MGRSSKQRIETTEDIINWIFEHDGRIDAYWENQHKWNSKVDDNFKEYDKRMSSVEKRMIMFSTVGSMIGAGVMTFVMHFIKSLP